MSTKPVSSSRGYYGNTFDRLVEREDTGPLSKVQHQYWLTKQTVIKKFGKKQDDHVVASDSELDAKLELFQSIHVTTNTLQRAVELYQDKLMVLSQEENGLGRFLKEHGRLDKTRAGKMMTAAGKLMSYTAQQRCANQNYHYVEILLVQKNIIPETL